MFYHLKVGVVDQGVGRLLEHLHPISGSSPGFSVSQLLDNVPAKPAEGGPSVCIPTYVRDLDRDLGSWLWPNLDLAVAGIWSQLENRTLCVCACNSF